MSDSPRLPARPSLEQLRKQAKELGQSQGVPLARAQFDLARKYGFESWAKLKHHIEEGPPLLEQHERLAQDLVAVCRSGDAEAARRLNDLFHSSLDPAQIREFVQQRLNALTDGERQSADLGLDDAQLIVARSYGFESWERFVERSTQPPDDPRTAPLGLSSRPPFYKVDVMRGMIEPRQPMSDRDWDRLIDVMKEMRLTGLNANGLIGDAAMARLAELDFVTRLHLMGSKHLTDKGLVQLARMPQLRELEVGGWDSAITDRGLEVLRSLTELRRFLSCWSRRISDAGVANLSFCDHLESVDLLGSTTGDGVIEALSGKRHLRQFKTGKQVTDAGLVWLHRLPCFETWKGGEIRYGLMSFEAEPTNLHIDGPFTSKGLESLAGLDGVVGLSFFWHTTALTADGLKSLAKLSHLRYLGCQGELCNDEAMGHISEIPNLRMLMAQGTVASDRGFAALSRSKTIEYLWGRECPNLGSSGFAALAAMPALRGLAVSCKNVDDAALAALPRFPALRGLMPMDVTDEGFRHVGQCEQLEDLWCMYCRSTSDVATSHVAGLSRLRTYYAGATNITDRSLETLARMSSLESVELSECKSITNAGLAQLARLPHLRQVSIGGSPKVTRDGAAVFPAQVRVSYSP